jgi:hypothetical protein
MTEQLMDDLTNEEHEALLLMSEHGIAAPLSPAADAVLDAWTASENGVYLEGDPERLAAALRAAADQFKSVEAMPGAPFCRNKLLAIANELEHIND